MTTTRFVTAPKSDTEAINQLADRTVRCGQGAYTSSATGAKTLTTAQFINGVYSATGTPGAFALTLPLAADVIAALPNAQVGDMVEFNILNNGDGTITLTTNTGWTLVGLMAILTLKGASFKAIITSATTMTIIGLTVAGI